MKIYIVRHAEAKSESEDAQRPLTGRGRKQAEAAAAFLKISGVEVDVIFHSTKQRAQQTAEIFKSALKLTCPIRAKERLNPDDSPQEMYEEVLKARRNVMIVGHRPFVDRLVSKFLCGDENRRIAKFSESAVAVLEQDTPPEWRLAAYVPPGMIKEGL